MTWFAFCLFGCVCVDQSFKKVSSVMLGIPFRKHCNCIYELEQLWKNKAPYLTPCGSANPRTSTPLSVHSHWEVVMGNLLCWRVSSALGTCVRYKPQGENKLKLATWQGQKRNVFKRCLFVFSPISCNARWIPVATSWQSFLGPALFHLSLIAQTFISWVSNVMDYTLSQTPPTFLSLGFFFYYYLEI